MQTNNLTNYMIRICDRVSEDKMVDERLEDGTLTHFNTSQCARVLKVKERTTRGIELTDHHLKGQKFIDQNGKIHTVKRVIKNWDCGFYISLMFDIDESETFVDIIVSTFFEFAIAWENINSIHPVVTEWVNESHKKYRQVICNLNL